MNVEEFRRVGHQLIDWIADYREGDRAASREIPAGAG